MTFTLKPGMYVSTEGMSEEDYHQVAKAFMAAGCWEGEYPDQDNYLIYFDSLGWCEHKEALWHQNSYYFGEKITIAQALSTLEGAEEEWSPKAGEVAGVVEEVTGHMEYGQHVLGKQVEVKSIFMSGDVEAAAVEHNGVCYCFRASMLRPITAKSEREMAVEEALDCIDADADDWGDAERFVLRMIAAGYRRIDADDAGISDMSRAETKAPPIGTTYYVPAPTSDGFQKSLLWHSDNSDFHLLKKGLVYLDIADAITRARIMLSA